MFGQMNHFWLFEQLKTKLFFFFSRPPNYSADQTLSHCWGVTIFLSGHALHDMQVLSLLPRFCCFTFRPGLVWITLTSICIHIYGLDYYGTTTTSYHIVHKRLFSDRLLRLVFCWMDGWRGERDRLWQKITDRRSLTSGYTYMRPVTSVPFQICPPISGMPVWNKFHNFFMFRRESNQRVS